MRLLLDTHALLWWRSETKRFAPETYEAISCGEHPVVVSHVTLWEIAIKNALGKLDAPDNLLDLCANDGFELLPVDLPHIEAVRQLPLLHRDPFDRMLVAQARVERLTLVTRDASMMRYDVKVMNA